MPESLPSPCPTENICTLTSEQGPLCGTVPEHLPSSFAAERLCVAALQRYGRLRAEAQQDSEISHADAAWDDVELALNAPDTKTAQVYFRAAEVRLENQLAAARGATADYRNLLYLWSALPLFRDRLNNTLPSEETWVQVRERSSAMLAELLDVNPADNEAIWGPVMLCLLAHATPNALPLYLCSPREQRLEGHITPPDAYILDNVEKMPVVFNANLRKLSFRNLRASQPTALLIRPARIIRQACDSTPNLTADDKKLCYTHYGNVLPRLLAHEAQGESLDAIDSYFVGAFARALIGEVTGAMRHQGFTHAGTTHPLWSAEELAAIDPATERSSTKPMYQLKRGWQHLELALATPETAQDEFYFQRMRELLEAVLMHEHFSYKDHTYRYAALTLIFEPLFHLRAAHREAAPAQMAGVYTSLGYMLDEINKNDEVCGNNQRGFIAELLTLALLLRLGKAKYCPYPASPREENSGQNGESAYHHDSYLWHDGLKTPLQVKCRLSNGAGVRRYDQRAVLILPVEEILETVVAKSVGDYGQTLALPDIPESTAFVTRAVIREAQGDEITLTEKYVLYKASMAITRKIQRFNRQRLNGR